LKKFANRNDESKASYYPALDGLRGLAIVLVLICHNFYYIVPFRRGWVGVDLFFVLSGFLISDVLLRKKNENHFLLKFYMRRILRIFPLYYLTLIICFFILPRVISSIQLDLNYFHEYQQWFWLFGQNWLFAFKGNPGWTLLDHLWSLATEEQFYLIWPWIVLMVSSPKNLITLLISLLVISFFTRFLLWTMPVDHVTYDHVCKFTRLDGLCVGCILNVFKYKGDFLLRLVDKILLFVLAVSIAILMVAGLIYPGHFPVVACCGYSLLALSFGSLLHVCLNKRNELFQVFNTKCLKFLGKISYGLYIVHLPVQRLSEPFVKSFLTQNTGLSNLALQITQSIILTSAAII